MSVGRSGIGMTGVLVVRVPPAASAGRTGTDDRGPQRGGGEGRPPFRGRDDREGSAGGERRPFRDRDDRGGSAGGERRPFRDRDDRGPRREGGYQGGNDRSRSFSRDSREERPDSGTRARYGRDDRAAEAPAREPLPELEPDITADELDKEVREELRSLPNDLAELVGRHMIAAERALEQDDPDKAYEHTKAARRFAARIGVVREAAGIVAYRAGHFSEALSDLRAARRMTGSDAYLPIMADCERGMGQAGAGAGPCAFAGG